MFQVALFIHILSAMGIFVGLALEWRMIDRLRSARSTEQANAALEAFHLLPRIGAPSTVLVLLSGLYLTWVDDAWGQGWPGVAVGALVLLGALGAASGLGREKFVRILLRDGGVPGPMWPRVVGRRFRPPLMGRVTMALGVLFLMIDQPGLAGSLVLGGVVCTAGLAGLIIARPHRMPASPRE